MIAKCTVAFPELERTGFGENIDHWEIIYSFLGLVKMLTTASLLFKKAAEVKSFKLCVVVTFSFTLPRPLPCQNRTGSQQHQKDSDLFVLTLCKFLSHQIQAMCE